jgi:hypothetical protein
VACTARPSPSPPPDLRKHKNYDRVRSRSNSFTSPFSPLPPVLKTEENRGNGEAKAGNSVSVSELKVRREQLRILPHHHLKLRSGGGESSQFS